MTHTTDTFTCTPVLNADQVAYLQAFFNLLHVKRLEFLGHDPLREKVGLPVGLEGEYCVSDNGLYYNSDSDLMHPPKGQPSLYCSWTCSDDGSMMRCASFTPERLECMQWIIYLNDHFFKKWGIVLQGEAFYDHGWVGERCTLIAQGGITVLCGEDSDAHQQIKKQMLLANMEHEHILSHLDHNQASRKASKI